MVNYHFVYKDVEGASTQWDDIQRKLGNLPPKPPAFKPPSSSSPKTKTLNTKTKPATASATTIDDYDYLCAPSTRKESVLMEANADMNMLKLVLALWMLASLG